MPRRTPHPHKKPMSLRGQCEHCPWQSVPPVPMAPLPKGGWHGEAVTGEFRSPLRTPCNAFVGATLAVARPLHLLLRFRRAGPMCPAAHRTPCKNHVIARAQSARGNPYPPSPRPPCPMGGNFHPPHLPAKNAPAPWAGAFSILSRPPHRSICAPLSAKSFLTLCFWAGVMRSLYCCASAAARAVSPPLK